ncbi:D-aminoacylase [Telmatospirillum sp.]|uniref:N-acyl-D-amino-acid deacylase family protein n=1 Tax=Telmatospirillum sp. TaxID=2079197 RepID=UPI00283E50FC|nr:D-aminoacylase [Telmatospirillum sp.]MDR3439494.1 D-aminoacylase [Telmatospirillum sp.]
MTFETVIRNVSLVDGSGAPPVPADLAITDGRIAKIGTLADCSAGTVVDGHGYVLCPGFVDAHTHDDIIAIRAPEMLPKLSQGVTSVIVGNCGISAAPVTLTGAEPPDPMNLLGDAGVFRYPSFADYVAAVGKARPAVNIAALVGHTALRSNHMDRLDRAATPGEIAAMRSQLVEALAHGALGLSTGLAYLSAISAPTGEVVALAEPLAAAGGIYTTHLRSETEAILDAMQEAFTIGREASIPVVVSHLKCAGSANWGRGPEVVAAFEAAARRQSVYCDCYPYTASASTIDLRQVTGGIEIMITWSQPHPEAAGRRLADIAAEWALSEVETARRLQPGGAIYHCMADDDVDLILGHPATMIGSDGLPNDPRPHPRLWGSFPRVLGHYSRDRGLFPLTEAVRKMTSLPAQRFGLRDRGLLKEGYWADLVLFNPDNVRDAASFLEPTVPAIGIEAVWVNGQLSYQNRQSTGLRAGRFLARNAT